MFPDVCSLQLFFTLTEHIPLNALGGTPNRHLSNNILLKPNWNFTPGSGSETGPAVRADSLENRLVRAGASSTPSPPSGPCWSQICVSGRSQWVRRVHVSEVRAFSLSLHWRLFRARHVLRLGSVALRHVHTPGAPGFTAPTGRVQPEFRSHPGPPVLSVSRERTSRVQMERTQRFWTNSLKAQESAPRAATHGVNE